ncbi:MAG: DNA primase [Patescibacteria group bacterium]|nr:DNA primase [Patescibacteria group bacterium]
MLDPKDEIKSRLDIVDIIGEYVTLKPAGVNHKALCPFHTEKTPSFMVSRDRQTWRCFGCSEGGDVFSFVMKMEGLDFPDALKLLAQKAGVTLRRTDPRITSHRNSLLEITGAAADYWSQALSSPAGAAVRGYIAKRGISQAAVETFGLGFAPDSWDATGRYLRSKGFADEKIFEAGLLVKKERGSGFYDRFRNRLMFPIHDPHGRVVGFGGRTLDPKEAGAKYINTPQTPIYNKGVILFNLQRAKSEIRTADSAVLVEGYMDALASWEAGVKNVVAVSGTALTPDQVKLLKRYTTNFSIAFDMDPAGAAAAWRGIDLVLNAECNVKVITLPFGKDPDECVRKDPAAWQAAVNSAVDFMEYCFTKTFERYPKTTAANKKRAVQTLITVIGKLGNAVEQAHWLQRLANSVDVPEQILREDLQKLRKSQAVKETPSSVPAAPRARWQLLEEQLVALLLHRPIHVAVALQWLGPDQLHDPTHGHLYRHLAVYHGERGEDAIRSAKDFQAWLQQSDVEQAAELIQAVDMLTMLAERDFAEFDAATIAKEIVTICTDLRREHLRRQLKDVQGELERAEQQARAEDVDRLSRQFCELLNQLRLLQQ